jgi:sugar O-acyltransferase (sialic acid O-acetyltransferase NeuD family)
MESVKYLFGASGHCKVIIDVLKSNDINVTAIFDDRPLVTNLVDIPVLETVKLNNFPIGEMIISIGDNKIRKMISTRLEGSFFTAIHTSSIISENTIIKNGTVVMAGAIINSDSQIGKHCIINTGVIVEHDCKIDDFVHISPNATLAGNVYVGEGTHVGLGACVIQGIKIGKWAVIGAGSVIIKDVPDFAVVVGNPGKILKINTINE